MADNESPLNRLTTDDPGDDVQRRFRYQHAFGAVLLLASIRGDKDYVSLWCEHHEDFLAETVNGKFDAFQVKTRDTEEPWRISDESFYGSIKRFVQLDGRAPDVIREFGFVTNAKPFETDSRDRVHLCPLKLLDATRMVESAASLNGSNDKALKLLADKTEIDQQAIFSTLKKTNFVKAMPLDGFESVIAHEHVAKCEPCRHFAASLLAGILDRLIALIFRASSLTVTDPGRHYAPLSGSMDIPQELWAKRVSSEIISIVIREVASAPFRYLPGLSMLQATSPESWSILKQKMERGGIASFFDMLYRRAISAEANLLALDQSSDLTNQIENLVADQCDEIRLKYHSTPDPCGDKILLETIERFETMARDQPSRTHLQQMEMLVGVAGLLASECKVWWSKPFELKGVTT
jgi:Cap4 dsDNA endonuclease